MTPDVENALTAILEGATTDDVESETLEFKTVGRSIQDTLKLLAEAAACFANRRGGTVMVGVADRTAGPGAFVGATELDPVRTQRRIYELTEPSLNVTVDRVDWQGHELLLIVVPVSPDVHAVSGRSTERIGASCEPMSPQRIATVVADRRGDDWSEEDTGLDLSMVDAVAMSRARSMLQNSPDPRVRDYAKESDHDMLRRLGAVTTRQTLNRTGALLFCQPDTPGELLTYVHRRTPAGALVVNERFEAPLLPAIVRVLELVEARVDRSSVNLPGGQQLQLADLPDAAVREAVINGLMHRDYRRRGAVQIEHTATRLVVTSPGPFVSGVTADNVLTTPSRSRNGTLAGAIRTLGLAETAGTGVDRMYAEMARVGHQPPTFDDDEDHVRVTLLGGAPNAAVARFVATLPPEEAEDADTMLVLVTLLDRKTIKAGVVAPRLQKDEPETLAVLDRLASDPVGLLERTRESARSANPTFRLREQAVAILGSAVSYRRRVDEYDRKIIGMVRETNQINARMVRLLLDLDTPTTSRVLADLVDREILVKTSKAQRGRSVTYGPGPRFPQTKSEAKGTTRPEDRDAGQQRLAPDEEA